MHLGVLFLSEYTGILLRLHPILLQLKLRRNCVYLIPCFYKFSKIILTSPTNISKINTPSPHQSTARVYEGSVNTSGARNSGVPQNVLVRSPKPMPSLQRPKSAIFRYPSESSSKLSNFKSLKGKRTPSVNPVCNQLNVTVVTSKTMKKYNVYVRAIQNTNNGKNLNILFQPVQ